MSKRISALVGTLILGIATALFAFASPANSASDYEGKVVFSVVGTNAVGKDTMSNRNQEYLWIKNITSNESINIANWYVRDAVGGHNTTKFNEAFVRECGCGLTWTDADELMLEPGHSLIVYTGAGEDGTDNSTHAYYKDHTHHYLNNTSGEVIWLRDSAGEVVDAYSYNAYGFNPKLY